MQLHVHIHVYVHSVNTHEDSHALCTTMNRKRKRTEKKERKTTRYATNLNPQQPQWLRKIDISSNLNGLEKYVLKQSNKPTRIRIELRIKGMYMCLHVSTVKKLMEEYYKEERESVVELHVRVSWAWL